MPVRSLGPVGGQRAKPLCCAAPFFCRITSGLIPPYVREKSVFGQTTGAVNAAPNFCHNTTRCHRAAESGSWDVRSAPVHTPPPGIGHTVGIRDSRWSSRRRPDFWGSASIRVPRQVSRRKASKYSRNQFKFGIPSISWSTRPATTPPHKSYLDRQCLPPPRLHVARPVHSQTAHPQIMAAAPHGHEGPKRQRLFSASLRNIPQGPQK